MAGALKNTSLAKNVRNCNSEDKLLMLMNVRHLYFNQMGDLILFPMKVHTNESSMANILYFAEAANIKGVYINTETSKEKLINVHIKYRKIIHFKACVEGIFAPILMTTS